VLPFDPARTPTDTAKIVVGIALGMAYLHSRRVLHRDLKPTNIFIDQAMRARIGDFGFSKVGDLNSLEAVSVWISVSS
jgi:serine/threonine protein kinase